ncbi:MAG: tetratricopeptide repeat protein [Candidatus Rokubacteria bacterium]|nr:tetratricopeptide repeat protein [Candidatus Rokubacteria bacterium]
MRTKGFLLVVFLFATGCAETMGIATEREFAQLRDEVSQLRQDLTAMTLSTQRTRSQAETRFTQVERQTRDQQAEAQRQMALLQTRAEALSAEIARLAGRLDEISHEIQKLRRQTGAGPSQTSPPLAGAAPAPSQQRGGPQQADMYQAAYLDFSKGNYPLAMAGFREFVRRFPDSDLADNAQYWIGEANFSLARTYSTQGQADKAIAALEQAVQEFRKVIVNYPRGDKAPTALYKEAIALLELKRTSLARARFQYLLDHFPQSEEAPLARERLAGLKESGER